MNRGVQVLRGEIRERGDQVKLAAKLEVDPAILSRVLNGLSPSLGFRQKCRAELGVELHWWDEPPTDESAPLETKRPASEPPPAAAPPRPSDRPRTGSSDPYGYG